jgi:tRNA A37 threonylcarbamoyladenosine dehydratase
MVLSTVEHWTEGQHVTLESRNRHCPAIHAHKGHPGFERIRDDHDRIEDQCQFTALDAADLT